MAPGEGSLEGSAFTWCLSVVLAWDEAGGYCCDGGIWATKGCCFYGWNEKRGIRRDSDDGGYGIHFSHP